MDARENEDKQKVSWTHALRQIVINCYKYHGREDLLPVFSEEEAAAAAVAAAAQGGNPGSNPVMGSVGVNPAGISKFLTMRLKRNQLSFTTWSQTMQLILQW